MKHKADGRSNIRHLPATRRREWYRQHDLTFFSIWVVAVCSLISMFPLPAASEDDFLPYQQFVKYDDDNLSLALSNMRASDAAQLMRSATGVTITLPTSTQSKTINLTLERAKMDQAIDSLLAALELNNSFLVYDREGHLTGVIALDEGAPQIHNENQLPDEKKQKKDYKELTAPEREALLREFRIWSKLSAEDRNSIHARLKRISPSKDRDDLVKEYVRLVLGLADQDSETVE